MRRIRKRIINVLAGLAVILITGLLTLKYQIHKSLNVPIPAQAQTVLRINNYELIKSLAWDWWQQSAATKAKKSAQRGPKPGLSIPINIIAYTLPQTGNSVWYTRLAIGHKKKFTAYVSSEMRQLAVTAPNISAAQSKNGKWLLVYNNEAAAIAFICNDSLKKEALRQLPDILMQKNTERLSGSHLKEICYGSNTVQFAGNHMAGNINYTDHQLRLDVDFNRPDISIPAATPILQVSDDAAMHIWWNAMLPIPTHTIITTRDFKIPADSLIRYSNGRAELVWLTNTIEKQPVVQYEMDDNFNESAQTVMKEKTIPVVWGRIWSAPGQALKAYLTHTNIIAGDSLNPRLFPLFTVRATAQSNDLLILSSGNPAIHYPERAAPGFAGIHIHFQHKAIPQLFPPAYAGYWKDLEDLNITATHKNHHIHISGSLSFRDPGESIFDIAANYQ